MLCKHTGEKASMAAAEKIRLRFEEARLQTATGEVRLTVSAGVATIPDPQIAQDAGEFLKKADRALYRSKQLGRDRVTHSSQLAAGTGG